MTFLTISIVLSLHEEHRDHLKVFIKSFIRKLKYIYKNTFYKVFLNLNIMAGVDWIECILR